MKADPGPILVPIKTWLHGPTFRAFEAEARKRGTEVGVLLSRLADKAIEPRPQRRGYTRMTPELQQRLDAMHRAGLSPTAIAVELGCSIRSVRNHLPREAGR